MELKNHFTIVFLIFILFAMPFLSRGRLKLKTEKLNSEIYEIDYRGPETHSYRPPPNRSSHGNPNGDPLQNSKQLSSKNGRKKVMNVHG